jgi:hypothetical protein
VIARWIAYKTSRRRPEPTVTAPAE